MVLVLFPETMENHFMCVIDRICRCLPMTLMSRDERVDEVRLEQCGRELAGQIRIDEEGSIMGQCALLSWLHWLSHSTTHP